MRLGRWLLLGVTLTLGCADDNVSGYIQHAVAPESTAMGCELSPDGLVLLRGTIDTGFASTSTYGVYVVVRNGLIARPGPVSVDPNGVFFTDLVVTVEDLAGNRVGFAGGPNPFTTQVNIFVPSGDGELAGTAVGYLPLLPGAYVNELAGIDTTLVFQAELSGHTQGGTSVELGPWQWVADTCDRCLLACDDPALVIVPGVTNVVTPCGVENILQILECS
jgi:hypothetical protein